jgi:flagellar hook-length control protein FliK
MEKLTIEQKVQGSTYIPVGQNSTAHAQGVQSQSVNLGGFAFSFDELLQRVGARLDHAFSAAEQANLFSSSPDEARVDPSANDVDRRDTGADRDDQSDEDGDTSVGAQATYQRDDGFDDGRDLSEPVNERASASDRSDSNDQGARQDDQVSSDDGSRDQDSGSKNADASDDGAKDQNAQGDEQNNGAESAGKSENGDGTAAQQAAAVTAAAIYNASYNASKNIKGGGEKTSTVDATTAQQALRGNEGAQAAAGQASAKQSGKSGADGKGNNHQAATNSATNTGTAAQKGSEAGNLAKVNPIQNQAQQLSRAIGPINQTNVNVTVNNEQAQVTSKPILTAANTSILTQDGVSNAARNQQQAGQQQQGAQGQTAQQLQAAQQQAQNAQQANNQGAQQAKIASGPTGGANTPSGIQSASIGNHSGGADGLNNLQNANSGQTAQQTQQSRDAQAQQQTQTAQRNQLQGSAVTEQISVKITKALQSGTDRISIQLKPAELGRVDVKLEMTGDGRVMTVVTAEKQDTLDLLRRDSSELQRALQDAGLQAGDMEFNLKGQEQQSADGENADNSSSGNQETVADDSNPEELDAGVVNAWESGIFMNGRLDVRA